MIIKKLLITVTTIVLSFSSMIPAFLVNAATIPMTTTGTAQIGSTSMAVESSNSYYAYSTEAVAKMSTIELGGKEYTLPITIEQLAADGWERSGPLKAKVGELYVVSCGDMQLSLSENKQGIIERIVELYPASGTLVTPGNTGIRSGISEGDLIISLEQIPLPWESAHLKNGTTKYKVLVPLGGLEIKATEDLSGQADSSDAAQASTSAAVQATNTAAQDTSSAYPACEYVITVGDQQVKAIEIRLVSYPGQDGWSNEVLGFKVASYYARQTGEIPPLFRIEEQKDGRVLVRLFEDLEDHIATWALYKADRTGKGYDEAFDPNEKKKIDFME